MRQIRRFLDDKLGYVLVIPALIFIILFSILPIVESTKFTFFDFQLNDQEKSGLYFDTRYNTDLSEETFDYITYFLDSERDVVIKEETKNYIGEAINAIEGYKAQMESVVGADAGIVSIGSDQIESINLINDGVLAVLDETYAIDDEFQLKDDMNQVASELQTSIIEANFSGMKNFTDVLKDERVWHAIKVTVIFTVASVSLELVFGLALALIMNKAMWGRGMIRTFSLIPWAIPTSVAALMWAYLYNGSSGVVAIVLEKFGIIANSTDLMLTSSNALGAIIVADVWKTTPYMALLLLAGLQVIPHSLYESSSLDGANKLQQFIHVTLPLLKPSILVALLFRTLDAFRVFDLIWVLTGGGPGGTTESISIYAYKTMFAQTRFGYGASVVLIMAVLVGAISYLYIKVLDVQLISE